MLYKDINLLPNQKKKSTKSSRNFIYFLLLITVLSFVGINYVYDPICEKKEIEKEIENTRAEIDSFGDVAGQYLDAKQKNNEYISRTIALKAVLSGSVLSTEVIDAVLDARIDGITIQTYAYTTGNVNVTISGDSYATIGEYITKLKKFPAFEKVNFGSIALGQKPLTVEQENGYIQRFFGALIPDEIMAMLGGSANLSLDDYLRENYGDEYVDDLSDTMKKEIEKESEVYTLQLSITLKDNK